MFLFLVNCSHLDVDETGFSNKLAASAFKKIFPKHPKDSPLINIEIIFSFTKFFKFWREFVTDNTNIWKTTFLKQTRIFFSLVAKTEIAVDHEIVFCLNSYTLILLFRFYLLKSSNLTARPSRQKMSIGTKAIKHQISKSLLKIIKKLWFITVLTKAARGSAICELAWTAIIVRWQIKFFQ